MNSPLRNIVNKYPFKNLVFQGGGVKTFAYHGVLQVLEASNILGNIKRVAGASAGASLATVLSFKMPVDQTLEIMQSIDYTQLAVTATHPPPEWLNYSPKMLEQPLEKMLTNFEGFNRLIHKFGWYTSAYPYHWLQTTIEKYCGGNGLATFKDFRKNGFRDLYVVVTNISKHKAVIFNADDTPDVPVAYAVLMSSSVPLLFEAVQFDGKQLGQGDYYGDGGLIANFPIHIFDHPNFSEANPNFVYGTNWETLGCRLFTSKDCPPFSSPINNLLSYIQNLLETMSFAQNQAFEDSLVDKLRTININDLCVSATDFHISPDSTNPKYTELVNEGYKAAQLYLKRISYFIE